MHRRSHNPQRQYTVHALVFVLVIPLLAVINIYTGRPYWSLWVFGGWGVGLLAHWFLKESVGAHRIKAG